MRRSSAVGNYRPFFGAALLAADFQTADLGFRQRDVRFYVELFTNWMEVFLENSSLDIQNVQISRYLDEMCEQGWATRSRRKGQPQYELTRNGLSGLLRELGQAQRLLPIEHTFFIFYFLKSYGALFEKRLADLKSEYSAGLRAELSSLAVPENMLRNQIRFLEVEIKKLDGRIEEADSAAALSESILKSKGNLAEVALNIQKKYPYDLNSRKPLSALIEEIPEFLREWELTQGFRFRTRYLWGPLRSYLEKTKTNFEALLKV